jgi:hypothetical protein
MASCFGKMELRLREFRSMRPSIPVLIHLDTPETGAVVPRENLVVTGWALHPEQRVEGVLVGIDRELWVAAIVGGRRPDVASEYPGVESSERAGWRTVLDLTDWPREEIEITVVALCADGTAAWEMPARVSLTPTRRP